jgi:hypothetical protein
MSGHVFHPGHHELHGITVVLETSGSHVYVGRFDKQDSQGVHLIGVSVFDPATATQSRDEFLVRTTRFGVRQDRPHMLIPNEEVVRITSLNTISTP